MSHNLSTQNLNPMSCDELWDLLPAYAVGAVTRDEAARVRELLPRCPGAEAELAAYAGLAEGLLYDIEPLAPPPSVKQGLLAVLAAERGEAVPLLHELPPKTEATPARSGGVAWWLLAAACALLVGTNIYWMSELAASREAVQALQREQAETLTALASSRAAVLSLQGDAGQSLATVFWDAVGGSGTLWTDMLPPLEPSQTYQLWLIDENGPASAAVFDTEAGGTTRLSFPVSRPAATYDAVGISVEPVGGSAAPTSDPIALWALEA